MRRSACRRAGGTLLALALGVALALHLVQPDAAWAHGVLRRSAPAAGDHLSVAPRELRLTFNERIELAVARVTLTGPHGAVELAPLALHPDSGAVLLAGITGGLVAGAYTTHWQVVGADGHPVRGEFTFVIEPGAAGLAPPPAPGQLPTPPAHHAEAGGDDGARFDAASPLYVVVRWLTFVGLLGLIGAVAFRFVLAAARRQRDPGCDAILMPAAQRAAQLGGWMAGVVLLAAALRLVAQSYALHGAARAFDAELIATMLSRTTWGWAWLLQSAAALVALAGFALVRRGRDAGWGVAMAAALVLAVTPALGGHAAATERMAPLPIVMDGLHVLGAAGWLGGLLAVLVAGIPSALRMDVGDRWRAIATLINAFSPTALFFAGLTVVTGVFAAWLHLGSIPALWQSGYGQTLLIKLAVLAGVFATGAYNWRRVRPALGSDVVTSRLRRSGAAEIVIGVLVLAVTAVLVATPAPRGDGAEREAAPTVVRSDP